MHIIGKIILVCFVVIAILMFAPSESKQKDYTLTAEQTSDLVYKIGFEGYNIAVKNKCLNEIAFYINTGEWQDNYCYQSYSHIDFGVE